MLSDKFVILAAFIVLIGDSGYFIDTLRGRAKPNRVTWLLWGLTPIIAFAAQRNAGVTWQSILTLAVSIVPLLIFTVSLHNPKAYWKIAPFDIVCGLLSVLAIILWITTGKGVFALVLSVVADFFAALPTFVKSVRHPDSETPGTYVANAVAGLLVLLTITHWTLSNSLFALDIFVVDAAIALPLLLPRSDKRG